MQQRSTRHRTTLLSAGVAFYALLALVPGLFAVLSLFGLLSDSKTVRPRVLDALEGTPEEVKAFIATQLSDIADNSSGTAITSIALSLLVSLWSASGGVGHLLAAIEVANGDVERRNMFRRRGTAIVVTLGAVLFAVVSFLVLTILPSVLTAVNIGDAGILVRIVSWTLLLGGMISGLSVIYRVGHAPNGRPKRSWLHPSMGAVVATVMWMFGSLGFSIYTENFASYNKIYGSLGAVVVVLLWLFISAYAVISGAEVDANQRHHSGRRIQANRLTSR